MLEALVERLKVVQGGHGAIPHSGCVQGMHLELLGIVVGQASHEPACLPHKCSSSKYPTPSTSAWQHGSCSLPLSQERRKCANH